MLNTKQVNWPKLNPRPWATEGIMSTTEKLRKDPVMGRFVSHDRAISTANFLRAEEGKKRIE